MSRNTKNGISKKVIVFEDSIIRGIRTRNLNQQVKNGYAKFNFFPGCNSKEMLHYIEPTFEIDFLVDIVTKCKSSVNVIGVNANHLE